MNTAYIALGSNVGDRLEYLRAGKDALEREVQIVATSPVYDTEPVDTLEPDRFLNAVIAVRTELTPEALLSLCFSIEYANGRVRSVRNVPRTLDLDLLLYGGICIDTRSLTLPHPRMHERAFVLAPLCDIAPEVRHPTLGVSMRELLARCEGKETLVRRTEYSL